MTPVTKRDVWEIYATTEFSEHHDAALVRWDMVDADGTAVSPGASFGTFGEDGRLTSMTGFLAQDG